MAGRINNIHDKFIRQILTDKTLAVSFLREYLPSELKELICFDTENTSRLMKWYLSILNTYLRNRYKT